MILCQHCKSTMNEDILKQKNSENICLVCGGRLDDNAEVDAKSDWITWYYYAIKSDRSSGWLLDKTSNSNELILIKEFKAPPRDANGNCDAAKKELRKYVPDAFAETQTVPKVQCPYCFSTEVQLVPKKFSILTGFATNSYNRVCVRCQRKF